MTATPLDFMERVIPWPGPEGPGWVNLHWKFTGSDGAPRWRGQPFKEAEAFLSRAHYLTNQPSKAEDLYFCTTVQSSCITHPKGFYIAQRKAESATLVKAIWLDIDVKAPPKGYASISDAVDAVAELCKNVPLPNPSAYIQSGGGLHVYWISERPLTVAEWRPFAEGLKAEAIRLGLRFDQGVTTDAARILRVPGTYNRKIKGHPRVCKVLGLGCDYDFARELQHLFVVGNPLVTVKVTGRARTLGDTLELPDEFDGGMDPAFLASPMIRAAMETGTGKLSAGIVRNDLPLDPRRPLKECKVLRNSLATGGRHDGQGLWNLVVLASTWFQNARDFAHGLSNQYPSYTEEETDRMFDRKMDERERQNLGWPSCRSFEAEGGKCKTCPFHGTNLGSPLKLADRVEPPRPLGFAAVGPASPTAVVSAADLRLPRGYVLDQQGKICYLPPRRKKDEEDPDPIPVLHGYVTSTPWTSGAPNPSLHFKYRQGKNYNEITLTYEEVGSEIGLHKALSKQTVMINYDAIVRPFMRAWVAEIDEAVKRLTTQPLGWVIEDGKVRGFAYGGKLYLTNGMEEECGIPHKSLVGSHTPTGEIGPILQAMDYLSQRNNPGLEAFCLTAWASPLLMFAGSKSAVIWCWSNESGAGKSTAILTGLAIWASPGQAKQVPGVTTAGLETTLDQLKNLPVVADEITNEERLDKIMDALQSVPEGIQGGRSTRGGDPRDRKWWKAVLTCGSNTSMHEHQLKRNTHTDAMAQRVFEIHASKIDQPHSKLKIGQLIESLDFNFGHIGKIYSKYLATHMDYLKGRYETIYNEVEALIAPVQAEERLWQDSVTMILLAAEIANEILPKKYFHLDTLRPFLIKTFWDNRRWVNNFVSPAGTAASNLGYMSKVLDHFMNNVLVTDTIPRGKGDRRKVAALRLPPENSGKGNPVFMQVVVKPAMMRFDYMAMLDYLATLKKGVNTLSDLMKQYGGSKKRNINMTAGLDIGYSKGRVDVWEIEITGEDHPLWSEWNARANSSRNIGFVGEPEPVIGPSASTSQSETTTGTPA